MSRTMVTETPALGRGFHVHPRKGSCLVEFAASLPGGPWTDHPVGVHPVLAALARRVNDVTSDEERIALLPWAAWLVATADERRSDGLATALATGAAAAALHHAGPDTATHLGSLMAGLAWPAPARSGRVAAWRQHRARAHSTRQLVRLAVATIARTPDPDPALRAVLADAVNTTRAHAGLPPAVVDVGGYPSWSRKQLIVAEMRVPDGAESTYTHATALPAQWPLELRLAWQARTDELRHCAERQDRPGWQR